MKTQHPLPHQPTPRSAAMSQPNKRRASMSPPSSVSHPRKKQQRSLSHDNQRHSSPASSDSLPFDHGNNRKHSSSHYSSSSPADHDNDLEHSCLPSSSHADPLDETLIRDLRSWLEDFDLKSVPHTPSRIQTRMLHGMFRTIVHGSHGRLDAAEYAPGQSDNSQESVDAWDGLLKSHPDFLDTLVECCNLDPPCFTKIRSLGAYIDIKSPLYLMFGHRIPSGQDSTKGGR